MEIRIYNYPLYIYLTTDRLICELLFWCASKFENPYAGEESLRLQLYSAKS